MKAEEQKLADFLRDLEAVCLKHNAVVDACGCCDSPWVTLLACDTDRNFKDSQEHIRAKVKHLRDTA